MKQEYQQLVKKAQKKDAEAFAELYAMHKEQVYRYVYHLCHQNKQDAQEIVQETFASAWEKMEQLRKPEYFPLWIKRIAHNKCIKLFEKNRSILMDNDQFSNLFIADQRIAHNPKIYVQDQSDVDILHLLMQELSREHQEIIRLFYFENRTIKELVELLDLPEGTVKSRIFQARKQLKKLVTMFEEQEQRKIGFHMDALAPSVFGWIAFQLHQGKKIPKSTMYSTLQVASLVVCMSSVTVASLPIIQEQLPKASPQEMAKTEEIVEFQSVPYKGTEITSAKDAYYALLKQAPKAETIATLKNDEKQALEPVVAELMKTDTMYAKQLKETGWYQTFYDEKGE